MVVGVRDDWQRQPVPRTGAGAVAVGSLHHVPAEVDASLRARGMEVDLLAGALPDIADV